MRLIYTLLTVLITSSVYAQIPSGYYDSATGSGFTLKTQLKQIINTNNDGLAIEYFHTNQGYDELYIGYTNTDVDNYYEVDGTVLDIYSENPSGSDSYNYNHIVGDQCGNYDSEADCYNREHVFPQGFYNENEPMRSDIHHVIPTDGFVNNGRGNLPFGVVTSANTTYSNGSKWGSGNNFGYTGNVFEPIDEFKGDVARMLLYFAVRYEDEWNDAGWDSHTATNNPLNGTSDQFYETWYINLLLDWHNNDPVSQREIDRNNEAFTYQGNRNPFIDVPAFANTILNPSTDKEAPSAPTNLLASNPTNSTIDLTWTASTDNVGVTSYDIYVDDINTYNTTSTSFTATGLNSNTNYCFTVYAKDAANNTSSVSNQSCETTTGGSSSTTELFISEYVEGSGNNKVIEIANFTGTTINLSSYTIARNINSGGTWGTALQLTGSIADQDVFVIAHGSSTASAQAEADQLSSQDAMQFNGDDPVGLFKNGSLIDIFGDFNGTNDYSNVTYVRKPSVVNPTTTFDLVGEWDAYPSDTFTDLGSHTQTLGINEINFNSIKLYPNPTKTNIVYINTSEYLYINIYNVLGKLVQKSRVTTNNNQIDISSLSKGIYLVQIKSNSLSVTKKLIKQ